jgi:hypothetical protein
LLEAKPVKETYMLPPVLEIYVVWHPGDVAGRDIAREFIEHFHGALYTGLIGGAVEVFTRSVGWRSAADAPRPIPVPGLEPPNGVPQAEIVAIVPVLGLEFARAVEEGRGVWHEYAADILAARKGHPERVCVLPLLDEFAAVDGTKLGGLFRSIQGLAATPADAPSEPRVELRCRELAQSIAQFLEKSRLQVFISHTKHPATGEEIGLSALIERVRWIIAHTRLKDFFDAKDLQPGCNWDHDLRDNAAKGALLSLRTDLYSSREWCQREVRIAKEAGLPFVTLDAHGAGDERGSFLMDHAPRVPVAKDGKAWSDADIRRGLNRLVDECLKRALWRRQQRLAAATGLDIAWWSPHAPEPTTLTHWIKSQNFAKARKRGRPTALRALHPDPPLGPDEKAVLDDIASLSGLAALDIMTPRLLAARGA